MKKTDKERIYDLLDLFESNEECPKCGCDIDLVLTQFKGINLKVGPVWQCPYCGCDVAIDKIVLKEVK